MSPPDAWIRSWTRTERPHEVPAEGGNAIRPLASLKRTLPPLYWSVYGGKKKGDLLLRSADCHDLDSGRTASIDRQGRTSVANAEARSGAPVRPVMGTLQLPWTRLCGVRRDPIRMCPYDHRSGDQLEPERFRLTPILQPYLLQPLEHIGSTAVPGLVAKPIIDMAAVVEDISPVIAEEDSLRKIGWLLAPEPANDIERGLSFRTPSKELRTHHLHVVEESFSGWRGWLAFRDYLRKNPEVAQEYGELNMYLSIEHGSNPNQRDQYRAGRQIGSAPSQARALGSER